MILLKTLTLGSRKYFLPESPSLQMIACCTRRFRSYCTMFSQVFVPSHLRFPSTVNPYENCIHLPFIQSFPVDLVITSCPEILSVVPRILWAYCLAVLYHMNTPIENSSHLLSIRSSPVDRMLHKILWNTIRPSEHPLQTVALQILVCLHYGCSHITSNIH